MRNVRVWLLTAGLASMAAPLSAQLPPASVVEIRDAQGQVVLRGQFDALDDDERYAALGPAGYNAVKARGEIELDARQVEGELRNLAPRTAFTIVIDGREVGVVTTDSRGRADFDLEN
jgi:hypothetical protein